MYTNNIISYEHFNYTAGFDVGFKMPNCVILKNLTEEAFLELKNSKKWIIKETIALEKPGGIDVSFYAYWDGESFFNKVIVIRHPSLLTGGQGIQLDDNLVTIFPDKSSLMTKFYKKTGKVLKEKEPEYIGYVGFDVNLIEAEVYYKKIHFGVTYDIMYCLEEIFDNLEEPSKPSYFFACSQRIYEYPYEVAVNMALEILNAVEGDDSWIIKDHGNTIKDCWNKLEARLAVYPDICYRTDGSRLARNIYNDLKRGKYI